MLLVKHHKVWHCPRKGAVVDKCFGTPKNTRVTDFKQLLGLTPLYCYNTWVTPFGSRVYRIIINWLFILSLILTKINFKAKLKISSHVKTWWIIKLFIYHLISAQYFFVTYFWQTTTKVTNVTCTCTCTWSIFSVLIII